MRELVFLVWQVAVAFLLVLQATAGENLKKTKAHTRYKNAAGKRVVGVTTALSILAKAALVPWANRLGLDGIDVNKYVDKTARIGTLAHEMIAAHLSGEPVDLEPYSPEEVSLAENALISFFEWEDQHKIEPEMVEEGMVSEEHQFGGTIDLYGEIDGKPGLVDFKTGKALYPEYFHQLAAYTALLEESGKPVKSVRIIRVGRTEDEGFEERVVDRKALEPHWQIFLHCLAIYNLKKEAK